MYRPRIIPVLLLKNQGLVKSIRFDKYRYIGDPINAVKIFNEKKADELVFLDITATSEKRLISLDFVKKVGDEANMPFSVGGGIRTVKDIRAILECGAEKVIIGTAAVKTPEFIREATNKFGSSTIVVCMDVKKNIFGNEAVVYNNGKQRSKETPLPFAKKMEECGVGEIIVQSVDKDGTYNGYDLELIKNISANITIPVIALGGAKNYHDFKEVTRYSYASAVAAGSMFVYHGARNAVLINFPTEGEIEEIF